MEQLGQDYLSILPYLYFAVFLLFGFQAGESFLLYRKHKDRRSLYHILMCAFSAVYGALFFLTYLRLFPEVGHKFYFTCWFLGFSSYLSYLYLIKWYLNIQNKWYEWAKNIMQAVTVLYFFETASVWLFDHSFFMNPYFNDPTTPIFFKVIDLHYTPSLLGMIVGGIGASMVMFTAVFTLVTLVRFHPKESLLRIGVLFSMCFGVNDIFLGLGLFKSSFAMVYLGNAFEAVRFTNFFQQLSYKKISELQGELSKVAKLAHVGFVASSINHDIMNPLSIIQSGGEVLEMKLKKKGELDPQVQKYLKNVEANCQRIVDIIGSYTALVRHENPERVPFILLHEVFHDALELSKRRIKLSGAHISLVEAKKWAIQANLSDISLVLTNLINNSCDEMHKYQEKWITLSSQVEDNELWVTVTDSGYGVPKEFQDKIFDLQFSTKEKGEGTGLGLGIVKEIIKRYDYDLFLNSNHERTQFVICIPLSRAKLADSIEAEPKSNPLRKRNFSKAS